MFYPFPKISVTVQLEDCLLQLASIHLTPQCTVKDLEPITRSMERLIIELDEAKVIRNPNPLLD